MAQALTGDDHGLELERVGLQGEVLACGTSRGDRHVHRARLIADEARCDRDRHGLRETRFGYDQTIAAVLAAERGELQGLDDDLCTAHRLSVGVRDRTAHGRGLRVDVPRHRKGDQREPQEHTNGCLEVAGRLREERPNRVITHRAS